MNNSKIIQDLISFLNASPTAWHAVSYIQNQLKQAGFIELSEQQTWKIEPGRRYFTIRNGSSICAFVAPLKLPKKIRLLASHTDSPSLKLKPHPEIRKHQAVLLGVEVYGAPLLSSWFNRDLGLAGRIVYLDKNKDIKESLVKLDQYPVTIPQLAIHLDREVNERGFQINKQEHLNALAGLESFSDDQPYLETVIKQNIELEQLISHEIYLYPLEKACLLGYQHSFLASYRVDSLASVHAALNAILDAKDPLEDEIKMIIFWDNEEVGSHTAQGAESPFFSQVVERIIDKYQGTKEDYFCLINRSTCISIDLAHALHPNFADKHDAHHQPILGKGIVIKYNAQQRYATNAKSASILKKVAELDKLQLQSFVSRNDLPCGSTIGPLQACSTGMNTIDIGCGQLSMHSSREMMACQDHLDMCLLLNSLFKIEKWPEVNS